MPEHITMHVAPQNLVEGQRFDQPAFHILSEAMPPGTRAELIDGVVYMPSPVGLEHGEAQVPVIVWPSYYAENTPGVRAMDTPRRSSAGRASRSSTDYFGSYPNTVAAHRMKAGSFMGRPSSSWRWPRQPAMSPKPQTDDYERAGVLEYVVRAFDLDEIYWYGLEQGRLVRQSIGDDGLYRSAVFPGLWLDPTALLQGDTRRLRAVVDIGCATPEHAGFAARLAGVRRSTSTS